MKKAYFVSGDDEEHGIAVIAESAREAKRIGYKHDCCCDFEFIEITAKWVKRIDASKLPIGMIDDAVEGIMLGIYSYVEDAECPLCYEDGFLTKVGDAVMCGTCEEKEVKK